MEVQLAVIADRVANEAGKLSAIGVTDHFSAPAFPAPAELTVVVRVLGGPNEAGAPVEARFEIILESEPVVLIGNQTVRDRLAGSPNRRLHHLDIIWHTGMIMFPSPGLYRIQVTINGQPMSVVPFEMDTMESPHRV